MFWKRRNQVKTEKPLPISFSRNAWQADEISLFKQVLFLFADDAFFVYPQFDLRRALTWEGSRLPSKDWRILRELFVDVAVVSQEDLTFHSLWRIRRKTDTVEQDYATKLLIDLAKHERVRVIVVESLRKYEAQQIRHWIECADLGIPPESAFLFHPWRRCRVCGGPMMIRERYPRYQSDARLFFGCANFGGCGGSGKRDLTDPHLEMKLSDSRLSQHQSSDQCTPSEDV